MRNTYRKIHLDYHTHPAVADVAGQFDPDGFAATLARAGVDNVVLFAKDHYGNAFFHSKTTQPHPNLKKNFLPLAVEACRKRGIVTEAYVSVCLDAPTFQAHPDWACLNKDGTVARWGEPLPLLDLASPLVDQVVLPFTREIVEKIPADGLWFDIVMYPTDAFYSPWITQELTRRGLADTAENRGILARTITVEAQKKLFDAARAIRPDIGVLINNQALMGDVAAFPYNDVIEIESDPSAWPQYDLPLRCRYLAGLGKPHHGLTTRFHVCWGDFGGLRSPAQLEFELGNVLAAGTPYVSLGDHLHPRGVLQSSVYRLIKGAYDRAKVIAPLVEDAKPLAEIALLVEHCPDPYSSSRQASANPMLGATRGLIEEHIQFRVADAGADLPAGLPMLLPGGKPLTAQTVARIKQQVAAGSPLLAFHNHVLGFEDLLGSGPAAESDLAGQHLRFETLLADKLIGDEPMAVYEKVFHFQPGKAAKVVAHCQDPLFDKTLKGTYHTYGPVNHDAAPRPAILAGKNVILCGVPLPQLIHSQGAWAFLNAFGTLVRQFVKNPIVRTDAGPAVEIAVHAKGDDLIVHLVSCRLPRPGTPPARMRQFDPIRNVTVSLRIAGKPAAVTRAGSRTKLPFKVSKGSLTLTLDLLRPHEVFVCKGAAKI